MIFQLKQANKTKELLIVNGYCDNSDKVSKCLELLKTLRSFNGDILYVSSCEIDEKISREVDYAFFQRRNLVEESNRITFIDCLFLLDSNRKGLPSRAEPSLVTRNYIHDSGLAHLDLIFQGIQIAQGLGYGHFHSFTYDIKHTPQEINDYLNKSSNALRNNNKSGYFIQHTEQQKQTKTGDMFKYFVSTCIVFSGNVDFFNQDYLVRKFSTYPRFDDINIPRQLVTKYWCGEHFMTACLQDYFNFEEFHLEEDEFASSFKSQCTDTHLEEKKIDRLVYNEPTNEIFAFFLKDPSTASFKINGEKVTPLSVTPRVYPAAVIAFPELKKPIFLTKFPSIHDGTYDLGGYTFINTDHFQQRNLVKTLENSGSADVTDMTFL